MDHKLRIGWIPASKNRSSASFRLRVDMIMQGLRKLGHVCEFYSDSVKFDLIIVSKKYDTATLSAIESSKIKNPACRVVFDLCDNHFYTDTEDPGQLQSHTIRVDALKRALALADAVTTSSGYLAEVVAKNCDIDQSAIYTIDDCFEPEQEPARRLNIRRLIAEIRLEWLKWRLKIINCPKDRFVWFGTHGVSYAQGGMFDLLECQLDLNEAFCDSSRTLTIISNSYWKYREISKKLNIKTFYLPWSQYTINRALRMHQFFLLPIKATPFTSAKSTNRPVTALQNGLQVICDIIPAYEKLRDYLIAPVNDKAFKCAINMTTEEHSRRSNAAKAHVQTEYSAARIAQDWESALLAIYTRN